MDWNEPKKTRWFNLRVIAWALFDFGATVFSMLVISRYFGPWVVDQMRGSVLAFNATLSLSMAVSGVLQVLLSPISDELGKRRIFVLLFTLLCVMACAFISVAPRLATGLALFAAANIGYQVAMVFYNTMLGDVSDERHRARISGIGIGLGYLGAIVGLLVSERFVVPDQKIYSPVFWVAAAMMLACALPLFLFVPEKRGFVRFNLAQSLRNSVGAFVTTLRRVARHHEMLLFFIACLLCLDAVQTVIANMALYCHSVVGLDPSHGFDFSPTWKGRVFFHQTISEINFFLITSTVFAIVGALAIGHIADKTDHYWTLVGVIILWIATLVLAMFSVQRRIFWFTGPLFGLGLGGLWPVSRAYLLDICHPEERGQMLAIYGLVGRCAAIIGPLVWGGVFTLFESSLGERKAYRLAIGAVTVLMLLGFWILLQARPAKERRP